MLYFVLLTMEHAEDCKQMAIKLKGRTRTGKFTDEEDACLIEKVRAVCGLPGITYLPLCHFTINYTYTTRRSANIGFTSNGNPVDRSCETNGQ